MARLVLKNGHESFMSPNEIGLHAQDIDTTWDQFSMQLGGLGWSFKEIEHLHSNLTLEMTICVIHDC